MASFLDVLRNSRARLSEAVGRLRPGAITQEDLDDLEESLIRADVGPETAASLVEKVAESGVTHVGPRQVLVSAMVELLREASTAGGVRAGGAQSGPRVWLLVGVNGSGKTTTTAKLAHRLRSEGRTVVMGAADTFRAAAVEQLQRWGERLDVPVIAQRPGADPSAVVFDTCEAARARNVDVALVDTAGRLHTKGNLMAEIDKSRRVAAKVIPGAPHEVLLVLDGTTGQNGLRQAEEFLRHARVTGLILAKLDGTARGGIALTIAQRLRLPIRYIGTGEGAEDLQPFDARAYAEALIGNGRDGS